jgi:formylmethanofuran dehydrogenase subunit E
MPDNHGLHLEDFLAASATSHRHLCPRQVLGVRMGIYAATLLQVPYPQQNKRLYTFVETDGCFADGIAVSTGCTLGHRTLRLMDYGKVAATFIDTQTNQALRIRPALDIRLQANYLIHNARTRWHAQLAGYQIIPIEELFDVQNVRLTISLSALVSRPGVRVTCHLCQEEIINEREIIFENKVLCRACAGTGYYQPTPPITETI